MGIPLGVTAPSLLTLDGTEDTGLALDDAPGVVAVGELEGPVCSRGGPLLDVARGCAVLVATVGVAVFLTDGGGGKGILGGGGIMRPVGLFTFFILAFALGGGMGVLLGVTVAWEGACLVSS